MAALKVAPAQAQELAQGISGITVGGYKSIRDAQHIEVRPLTILAGANSSGKSSIMQPLLLLKQTLEAPFDPGPLWLGGPNVEFTSVEQMVSRGLNGFRLEIAISSGEAMRIYFISSEAAGILVEKITYTTSQQIVTLWHDMTHDALMKSLPYAQGNYEIFSKSSKSKPRWIVVRDRYFLEPWLVPGDEATPKGSESLAFSQALTVPYGRRLRDPIARFVHIRGLRGNPERTYPTTAIGSTFPGRFEPYVASIIAHWQAIGDSSKLTKLAEDLRRLDLTSSISANRLNDVQVELQVGPLPTQGGQGKSGKKQDMVNIADVGFGVSQALPVLVALNIAEPGQLVYLEQPEIHLHPRAQWQLARVLADAARRGVRVVAETHSSLLLLGIQTLVAQGELDPDLVKLHWFKLNKAGNTEITSADLDESGGFGDWPENFADVTLGAQIEYLNAANGQPQAHL